MHDKVRIRRPPCRWIAHSSEWLAVMPRTIGEALVARRQTLGLDKGRAANRIGMSRTSYGAYERDAQRPSIEVFAPLIEFLSISLDEFLTLYGATCIAIARASFDEPTGGRYASMTSSGAARMSSAETVDVDTSAVLAREGNGHQSFDAAQARVETTLEPPGAEAREPVTLAVRTGEGATSSSSLEYSSSAKREKKSKKRKHKKRH